MNSVTFAGRQLQPSKIVCAGRNYAAHVEELGNAIPEQPVLFIKPNSAISAVLRAVPDTVVHYEGEISFVIQAGRIAGVGFGLDLTKRDLQESLKNAGLPWERAKAFDGAAVFSDFVPFSGDPDSLRMELIINGRTVQAAGGELMLTRPTALLAEIGANFTLSDGDLLMTGTPRGVGPLNVGDVYEGRIYDGGQLLVSGHWVVE
jgi:2-keto-4-pentenoate hydratase/2-oxohepta-3-ene-1,7-dioic acid hydratase in catechol pathway